MALSILTQIVENRYPTAPIAIYNSKAFKAARTTCSVHRVDSAHYTLYRGNLIKGGKYNGTQVLCTFP